MKKSISFKVGLIIMATLFVAGCSKEEEGETFDYGQSFTFTYADNTPVVGASVKVSTSLAGIYVNMPTSPIYGTTDETGTVYFTKEELNFGGASFPTDLYILAEKGYYSNIEEPASFPSFSNELVNQNRHYTLNLSFLESLSTPTKWILKRSIQNGIDITSTISDCSLDNFLTPGYRGSQVSDPEFVLYLNEGDLICDNSPYFYCYALIQSFRAMPFTLQDGYTLASGGVSVLTNNGVAFGATMELEISYDSLYLSGNVGGNNYESIYVPVF